MNNRTTESLLARRALAEKATPGRWDVIENLEDQTQCSVRIISPKHHIVLRDDWITFTDALFIVRHSPDVVMADIDEILSLRAENKKLKKRLETAEQTAKLAWDGKIPSPLPGHRSMTEDEVVAMFEHLNCPWCGGSGHIDDCEEADQQVKARLERLEKEADWLARICANQMLDGVDEASVQWWREKARDAARKAV